MPKVKGGPDGLNNILEAAYASCMKDGGDESKCSAIAWGAAKNAGWKKVGTEWKLEKADLPMMSEPGFSTICCDPTDLEEAQNWAANRVPIAMYSVPQGERCLLIKAVSTSSSGKLNKATSSSSGIMIRKMGSVEQVPAPEPIAQACKKSADSFTLDGYLQGNSFTACDATDINGDISKKDFIERRMALEKAMEGCAGDAMKMVTVKFSSSPVDFGEAYDFASKGDKTMLKSSWGPYEKECKNSYLVSKGAALDLMVQKAADGKYDLACMDKGMMKTIGSAQSDKKYNEGAVVRVAASSYDPVYDTFGAMKILGKAQSPMTYEQCMNKISSPLVAKEIRIRKADEEQRLVLGVVLEPDTTDLQGDVISADEIEKTAHDFVVESRQIGFGHTGLINADLVESYIARSDFDIGGDTIKKGSWVLGVRVNDPETWQKVKNKEINSFSIGGFGLREQVA